MNAKNIWIGIVVLALVGGAYYFGTKSKDQTESANTTQGSNLASSTQEVSQPESGQAVQPSTQVVHSKPAYYTPMNFPSNVESVRPSFVNGCISTGGNTNYCNCTFDYLMSNYGLTWLLQANANYQANGVVAPESKIASQNCAMYKP